MPDCKNCYYHVKFPDSGDGSGAEPECDLAERTLSSADMPCPIWCPLVNKPRILEHKDNIVTVALIRPDEPTHNGRIYPKDVWLKAIEDWNKDKWHYSEEQYKMPVTLAKVSHLVSEIRYDESDNETLCDIRVLVEKSEGAELMAKINRHQVRPYLNSMGSVTTHEDGTETVNDDLIFLGVSFAPEFV